jgi:hypothetical protein
MPGLISGVRVNVGTTGCVAVVEGGNQTIVGVGVAVSVAGGVSEGAARSTGRQAIRTSVIARSETVTARRRRSSKPSALLGCIETRVTKQSPNKN